MCYRYTLFSNSRIWPCHNCFNVAILAYLSTAQLFLRQHSHKNVNIANQIKIYKNKSKFKKKKLQKFKHYPIVCVFLDMSVLRQCGLLLVNPNRLALNGAYAVMPTLARQWSRPALADETPFLARGHKKFGHQSEKTPNFSKFFHLFIGSVFIITLLDFKK